jgi:hypothetical protein
MSEEEIKNIAKKYAYAQIKELARFIQSDRINYYPVDILNWYTSNISYSFGMQPLIKLFEYFFVYGGRYLRVTTDKNKHLVFEFHSQDMGYKIHNVILLPDKILYQEVTTGMAKVLDWEIEYIPVVKAKNKVLQKAPAGVF